MSREDLQKVYRWIITNARNNPYHLREAVWFLHALSGGTRGMEIYRQLKVGDVKFHLDEEEEEYMTISEDRVLKSKNYKGGLSKKSHDSAETPRIYKMKDENICLVSLMKFYLQKMRK